MGCDAGYHLVDAVDVEIGMKPWLAGEFYAGNPAADQKAGGVGELRFIGIAAGDVPAEDSCIKGGGLADIGGWNNQIRKPPGRFRSGSTICLGIASFDREDLTWIELYTASRNGNSRIRR